MIKNSSILLLAFTTCLSIGCKQNDRSTHEKFQLVLRQSGENSTQLLKTIAHYSKNPEDSLKLKAAYFLIENMIGKGSYRLTKTTEKGVHSDFDVFNPNFKFKDGYVTINKLKKQYEDSTGSGLIYYTNPEFVKDIKIITSDYLIENIDYAFKAWELPWAKSLSFDQFKEYVLPYRFGNEPLESWRKHFFEQGSWIYKNNVKDRFKLAAVVNDSLIKTYSYLNEWIPYYSAPLSINQTVLLHGGRCPDLNVLTACLLRANGVPVASEFTNTWGNGVVAGHSWLGILDVNGKFVPMNAVYDAPIRGAVPFKTSTLAKGYRVKFEVDPLFYTEKEDPTNYVDITKEYVPVVNYEMKTEVRRGKNISLAVLNGLEWKIIETPVSYKNGNVIFKDIGRNIIYAPATLVNDSVKIIGLPFLVTGTGHIQKFDDNSHDLGTISLDGSRFELRRFNDSLYKKKCEILFWESRKQKWTKTGSTVKLQINPTELNKRNEHVPITFNKVPKNALYLIVDMGVKLNNRNCGRPYLYNEESKRYEDH